MDAGSALLIAICISIVVIVVIVFRKITLSSRIETGSAISHEAALPMAGTKATVSKTLRPVGVILVENTPYEATSEGEFIEPGAAVTVIGKLAGRALVRKA